MKYVCVLSKVNAIPWFHSTLKVGLREPPCLLYQVRYSFHIILYYICVLCIYLQYVCMYFVHYSNWCRVYSCACCSVLVFFLFLSLSLSFFCISFFFFHFIFISFFFLLPQLALLFIIIFFLSNVLSLSYLFVLFFFFVSNVIVFWYEVNEGVVQYAYKLINYLAFCMLVCVYYVCRY